MAKGSVRKKGKKWYYRFYVEGESGNLVQKEYVGTESKSETESLLRKAMEDYESKRFVAKSKNVTLGALLDMWVEESLKPGKLSNGTVITYQSIVRRIKHHPIANRKLKTITADHLQAYMDSLAISDGVSTQAHSKSTLKAYSTVLQKAFRFAVFPKRLITFNPMPYVTMRGKDEDYDLFSDEDSDSFKPTLDYEQYNKLVDFLKEKDNPALLPVQIAYFTGLRLGEVCGLTWQDINLDEQYLTVRRSLSYNKVRHKVELGTTKRRKIRTVDFCDTLASILKAAKLEQQENCIRYGELYSLNYYVEVQEKSRTYYEVYSLPKSLEVPQGYKEISLVCLRPDGTYESSSAVSSMCDSVSRNVAGLEGFHFHMLRHTYTSNLLANGAAPKDVQELLGHSDVSTTMNIYAHAAREAKRTSARLLDKVVGTT